jgi:type II secretory pathway pseudopilin PulG
MVMARISMNRSPKRGCAQRGFTYIGLLLALAIAASGLSAAAVVWHTEAQRAKEAELLFIGGEFKRAIAAFYAGTPGTAKQLPKRLEDLLRDNRYPAVRRYLRKLYVDPLTGRAEWGVVATPAGITGVYSLSEREPFKNRANSAAASVPGVAQSTVQGTVQARRARKYSDWKFIAEFEQPPAAPDATPAPDAPATPNAAPPAQRPESATEVPTK